MVCWRLVLLKWEACWSNHPSLISWTERSFSALRTLKTWLRAMVTSDMTVLLCVVSNRTNWTVLLWNICQQLISVKWLVHLVKNENSVIIYSLSSCFKPVSFFCWTQKKIFWRMSITRQLMVAIDFHSIFFFLLC